MKTADTVQLLIQELNNDAGYIQENCATLEKARVRVEAALWNDELDLLVLGGCLHAVYNAFEAYFLRVAKYFENSIDQQMWHRDLIDRMSYDIPSVRPALLTDPDLIERIDELRRFRHLFRNLYKTKLKANKLKIVDEAASEIGSQFIPMHDRFILWLENLATTLAGNV
jgi:hypothetical protein